MANCAQMLKATAKNWYVQTYRRILGLYSHRYINPSGAVCQITPLVVAIAGWETTNSL